jgi:hypothetical protein
MRTQLLKPPDFEALVTSFEPLKSRLTAGLVERIEIKGLSFEFNIAYLIEFICKRIVAFRLIMWFTLRAVMYFIMLLLMASFGWTTSQDKSQNRDRLQWENLTRKVICQYNKGHYCIQALEKPSKDEYVAKTDIEELVGYAFTSGYLCNDEDRAMCIQKITALDVNTTKKLTAVVYYFGLAQRTYVYKIEVVDEIRTFIGQNIDVDHNLVSQKDWLKYKNIEKLLIKQKIIRDGDTSLNTGQRIPLDGQPDFIFEDTYIKTKNHTLIHAENKTDKIDLNAPKILKNYIEELLEHARNGFD